MPQPDREVRGLRNDLRELCAALDARLLQVLEAAGKSNTLAEDLAEDLTPEDGLGVRLLGQAEAVETTIGGGSVTVANPPDVAGVESAVVQNSETFNSTAWAIFGLVVGFCLLGVFFKLVRP